MAKTLFIKTYGCQMNVYDSARIVEVLAPLGFAPVDTPAGADMVILNTCHIREKATEKVFGELGRLRRHKNEKAAAGERMILAVAGCVAQAEGEEILRRAPFVDIVLGPQTYHRLPEMVARASRAAGASVGAGVLDTEFPVEPKFDHLPGRAGDPGVSAFLTIQEGCDKFCTFCVVPYTRGAEASRPPERIIAEARGLVDAGAREITLLGQNVNAYHGVDDAGVTLGLGGLARRLAAAIPGLARIRYTTSHPRDVDDALIAAHAEVGPLMPFVHLPVQSGSDRILAAMNRRHTAADYHRTVSRLRRARAGIALGSDFIVGFPGETDADFAATLALVEEVGFAQAYSFKYSPRPGTPAATLPGQVPEAVKDERLAALQALLDAQQARFNAAGVGGVTTLLIEREGRRPGQMVGRTPHNQAAHVAADPALRGVLAPVRIARAGPRSLEAALLDEAPRRATA